MKKHKIPLSERQWVTKPLPSTWNEQSTLTQATNYTHKKKNIFLDISNYILDFPKV